MFKLVTYEIAKELMTTRMGYNNRNIYLPLLLFADDGLVLSQSEKETEMMIKVLTQASEKCGLKINKQKSGILIFQEGPQEVREIGGIPVGEQTKYLGVQIVIKKEMFAEQKKTCNSQGTETGKYDLYGITSRSCNKLMIGKTYWKSVALPSILYGTNVVTLVVYQTLLFVITHDDIIKLYFKKLPLKSVQAIFVFQCISEIN